MYIQIDLAFLSVFFVKFELLCFYTKLYPNTDENQHIAVIIIFSKFYSDSLFDYSKKYLIKVIINAILQRNNHESAVYVYNYT